MTIWRLIHVVTTVYIMLCIFFRKIKKRERLSIIEKNSSFDDCTYLNQLFDHNAQINRQTGTRRRSAHRDVWAPGTTVRQQSHDAVPINRTDRIHVKTTGSVLSFKNSVAGLINVERRREQSCTAQTLVPMTYRFFFLFVPYNEISTSRTV